MFCHYRRFAPATKPAGQDVFSEYRRHARNTWSGSAPGSLLLFCYRFAIHLLPQRPSGLMVATLLLLICYRTATTSFCVPSPRHVSDVYIAAPQGCPFRIPVIAARCPSALNRPPFYPGYAMPDGLANASRAHSKLRPRSPLSMGFSEPLDKFAGF